MRRDGEEGEPTTLEQVLDRIEEAAQEDDPVSVGEILDVVGRRSFGPLLLLAGITTLAPLIGDIPGVPTVAGLLVLLVALQMLIHREHVWLPRWLLERSTARDKLCKAVAWSRRPAKWLDRLLRPRLTNLTEGPFTHVIAVVCIAIAMAMPFMEVVPFSANFAGAALTAFGLALIAHDGLLALFAFIFTSAMAVMVAYNMP